MPGTLGYNWPGANWSGAWPGATGREPLDAAPVWEDPRAQRVTRVASDVIRRTVQGSAGNGSGGGIGGGGFLSQGRGDLNLKHRFTKTQWPIGNSGSVGFCK